MKSLILYVLFFIGLATLIYYIYLIVIGKRLAHLMQSKDRYIWNGLRNLKDSAFGKKSTVFLDDSRLIVAKDSLTGVYSKLRSGGLTDAIVIPFEQIVAFDYDKGNSFFLIRLFNRIFKVNNFILKVDYLDPPQGVQRLRFRASSMDPLDFESAFADFNNKIYGDTVLLRSQDDEDLPAYPTTTADIDEDKTAAVPSSTFEEDLSNEPLAQEADLEQTTVLPVASFEETSPVQEIEEDLEKTTIISPSQFEELEEEQEKTVDLEGTVVLPAETLREESTMEEVQEATTIIPLASLEEEFKQIEEKEELPQEELVIPAKEDLEKTTQINHDELRARFQETKEQETKFSDDQGPEVKRRSFLDRKPREKSEVDVKKEVKPTEAKPPVVEDKTIAVELPDELKRPDTSGLTDEEISAQEMERLRKLKEFFSQENSENH